MTELRRSHSVGSNAIDRSVPLLVPVDQTTIVVPDDVATVRAAFRLGWAIAELRGRYRLGRGNIGLQPGHGRTDFALPLAPERSEVEQKHETEAVIAQLVSDQTLKVVSKAHEVWTNTPGTDDDTTSASAVALLGEKIDKQLKSSRRRPPPRPTEVAAWTPFAHFMYKWDEWLQDRLVGRPMQAAAYQLGRGLSETYWALDPATEDQTDWRSWSFLLGEERRALLKRQLGRLTAYVDPLTPPAIIGSLDAWGEVATDAKWRSQDVLGDLYQQTLLWRDLVRGERDPKSLVDERQAFTQAGLMWPIVKAVGIQTIVSLVFLAALVLGIIALAKGKHGSLSTIATVFGSLGVTSTTLYTRAKVTTQRLGDQLRATYFKNVVGRAATIRPKASLKQSPVVRTRAAVRGFSVGLGVSPYVALEVSVQTKDIEGDIQAAFVEWLRAHGGFSIFKRNVRSGRNSYDLIAHSAEETLIIEIKATSGGIGRDVVQRVAALPAPEGQSERPTLRRAVVASGEATLLDGTVDQAKQMSVELYEVWPDGSVFPVVGPQPS